MNNFLIPANSKKSLQIFGLFNKFDLILFGSGIILTILLLLVLPVSKIGIAIIALLPAVITGLLVMPVPYYHNTLTVLISVKNFYFGRRKFVWKGWCFSDGEQKK